jgi:hypothetical protein
MEAVAIVPDAYGLTPPAALLAVDGSEALADDGSFVRNEVVRLLKDFQFIRWTFGTVRTILHMQSHSTLMVHQRREVPFAHPAIPRLIQKAMFLRVDKSFRSEFETTMPAAAVALACTTVRFTGIIQSMITDPINRSSIVPLRNMSPGGVSSLN